MASFPNRETLFGWAWRLTVLSLPWQTRYIIPAAEHVAVWREQWNYAIYASWIPLLATVFLGLSIKHPKQPITSTGMIGWITVAVLVIVSFVSTFPAGTFQWWIQVAWLSAFCAVLIRNKVDGRALAAWFVVSLLPHALLAIEQIVSQRVFGSTLFGIASQLPETRGVAVVEAGGARFLRAYGGFPYPNILGGWLAFGIPAAIWLASCDPQASASIRKHPHGRVCMSLTDAYRCIQMHAVIFWSLVSALLTTALVLSHSRSAWIAVAVLLIVFGWRYRSTLRVTRYALPSSLALCALLATLIWQWPIIVTRTTIEGRLEERSVSERVSGLNDGLGAFIVNPVFGVGRNAYGWSFDGYALPHNVPLLALAETGIIGAIGHVILLLIFLPRLDRKRLWLLGPSLLIIALLDHYPWSYWPGQALVAFVILFITLPSRESVDIRHDSV